MTTQGGAQLDALLAKLEERATKLRSDEGTTPLDPPLGKGGGDAIDQVLASPPRVTQTQSLRDHETVQKFREEMATGLIQIDTAMEFLKLILAVV